MQYIIIIMHIMPIMSVAIMSVAIMKHDLELLALLHDMIQNDQMAMYSLTLERPMAHSSGTRPFASGHSLSQIAPTPEPHMSK
ncbi:hypothetical protein [Neoaquamicrobium sediminum]|uniref:hypothetical protein n=1 Tax=Neoaquamicrobium sediminum TaxID=1849104 RepID=UPI00403662FC